MIVRGQRRTLVRPIETKWGIYQPGHEVILLRGSKGRLEVCLDSDGHSPSLVCHEAAIEAADLFIWPDDIDHGTDAGYTRHRSQLEPPCVECRDHYTLTKRAQRIRTGVQAGVKVPRAFLGELLQSAPLKAWTEAERLWGRAAVDALLDSA